MQQHCSTYFAHRAYPTHPHPRTWGRKVKNLLFQIIVMLHIKLKGITNAATWSQIFSP